MILITFYVMITCMQNKKVWIMGIGLADLCLLGLEDTNIACDATLHDVLVRQASIHQIDLLRQRSSGTSSMTSSPHGSVTYLKYPHH